jgi:hypothetical protein
MFMDCEDGLSPKWWEIEKIEAQKEAQDDD